MNTKKKIFSAVLAASLSLSLFTGCQQSGKAAVYGKASKPENFVMYLYGGEGVANKTVLNKINASLTKSINATLTVKYIDWNDIATKYPLLFASGENFDMIYVSSNSSPAYSTLASQGSLANISKYLSAVPTLKKTISQTSWNQAKVNGGIYAVPSNYTEFTPYGFAYNETFARQYKLKDVTNLATMQAYMDAVLKYKKYAPLNGSSNLAEDLYRMFVDTTGSWIYAPGIANSDIYLVASSAKNYKDVISPVFTSQFENWAVKMSAWAKKGYWEKDIMASQKDDKDNFISGQSGAFITHMSDWSGNYGNIKTSMPNVKTNFWTFAEANHKIEKTPGIQNATALNKNCKDPKKALQIIEKLMTDKNCYDLFQYGILGKQYVVKDNAVSTPASFNKDKDAFGFAGWALRNDKFNIRSASEDTRRYTLNAKWNKMAIDNPFAGFNLDTTSISNELSSVTSVNATYGVQIMLGKESSDPKTAVANYRNALKSAGIDKIIAAVKKQLSNYKPAV